MDAPCSITVLSLVYSAWWLSWAQPGDPGASLPIPKANNSLLPSLIAGRKGKGINMRSRWAQLISEKGRRHWSPGLSTSPPPQPDGSEIKLLRGWHQTQDYKFAFLYFTNFLCLIHTVFYNGGGVLIWSGRKGTMVTNGPAIHPRA